MNKLRNRLRNIDFLKKNYRNLKTLKESIGDKMLLVRCKISNTNYIFSHYARIKNFGDSFNNDLLSFFGARLIYVDDYKKSEVALTGSILHLYPSDYSGFVLGSGFIRESLKRENILWNVRALRGPLSAKQCGLENKNIFFGDPGILTSLIYPNTGIQKKYKLGILPHSSDYDDFKKKKFDKDVLIISPRRSAKKVAKDIKSCENIASSSLHGLIFADSYGIPNIHLKCSNKLIGGNHKFIDYYLGMNTSHEFIFYDDKGIDIETIVNNCKTRFSPAYVSEKQKMFIQLLKKIFLEIKASRKI